MRRGSKIGFSAVCMMVCMVLGGTSAPAASLKKGYAMCRDQVALQKLLKASAAHDSDVFERLMGTSCIALKGGERARVLVRTKTTAHLSVKGHRGRWWTVVEAVR